MAKKKVAPTVKSAPNPVGRPIERNRAQIALQMLEWATKSDSINLCGFCVSVVPPLAPPRLVQYANESPEFKEAYETVKAFIGARREKMLNSDMLHVKAYDLNAAVYDYFLKQEKRDQAAYEASLKTQTEDKINPEAVESMTAFFKAVKGAQDRSIDDINNKADTKS